MHTVCPFKMYQAVCGFFAYVQGCGAISTDI